MKIVYVDSFKIRNTADPNFGVIDHRYTGISFAPTWYIPKGEIWIEKRLKDETEFLLKVSKLEWRLAE